MNENITWQSEDFTRNTTLEALTLISYVFKGSNPISLNDILNLINITFFLKKKKYLVQFHLLVQNLNPKLVQKLNPNLSNDVYQSITTPSILLYIRYT